MVNHFYHFVKDTEEGIDKVRQTLKNIFRSQVFNLYRLLQLSNLSKYS